MPGMSRAERRRKERQSAAAPVPSAAPARWLQIATFALAAVCLLGLFSTQVADTDFWWHLKTGEYLAQQHKLPVPDPFAYTTPSAAAYPGEERVRHFNLTHEWLSQLLIYSVYAAAGFGGIVLMRALLLAMVCGLAGWLAARLSGQFYAGVAAAGAAASVMASFAADRPGVVSFLGVAVLVCLLEMRRGWWALPLLMLLWANCHGGFVLGWVVLAAYCVEELLQQRDRRLFLWAALAIVASGINPNGFGVLPTILSYRHSPLTASLIEWQPPRLWGEPYGFDVLLYTAAAVLILSWRKVRPAHWLLFAAFAAASLAAFRNTALIGFLAPVLIAAYFPWHLRMPSAMAWAAPVVAAVALIAGLANGRFFQFGVADWTLPRGAADFLAGHGIAGPIFNTYEQGGYLIWRLWPDARVFIDGRSLSESVYRDYRQILYNEGSVADQVTGPREELLERYGVQAVVMNAMDYVSGTLYPMALALANPTGTEWQLVYDDAQAVVFLKNPPPAIPPLSNKLGRMLRHMDRECESYIAAAPDYPLCARTLARYWTSNQAPDEARRMLTLYLEHAPRDAEAAQMLRNLDSAPLKK